MAQLAEAVRRAVGAFGGAVVRRPAGEARIEAEDALDDQRAAEAALARAVGEQVEAELGERGEADAARTATDGHVRLHAHGHGRLNATRPHTYGRPDTRPHVQPHTIQKANF